MESLGFPYSFTRITSQIDTINIKWQILIRAVIDITLCNVLPQAFDVPGVSEYAEASNMLRNSPFCGEIVENTVSDHIRGYCIF